MQHVRLGLIGDKIQASRSPDLHRLAGRLCGLDVSYDLLIPPARGEAFDAVFDHCRAGGFRGINITYPYKETVLSRLAAPDSDLVALGACNTVVFEAAGPKGANTDSTGFASAFRHRFGDASPGIVAMAGAGGVGKAIAFALASLDVTELNIFDADRAKAEALSSQLNGRLQARVADDVAGALQGAAGVVNGTPVGMLPDRGMAVPDALLHRGLWVADAVYTPLWTPLLVAAKAKGASVMTGRDLAVYQAADAFELFTGLKPPVDVIQNTFDAVMASRYPAT
jgi:shikimate dehydrogenase